MGPNACWAAPGRVIRCRGWSGIETAGIVAFVNATGPISTHHRPIVTKRPKGVLPKEWPAKARSGGESPVSSSSQGTRLSQ
jgi:hypothetical protein